MLLLILMATFLHFSFLLQSVYSAGAIDLNIRQLVLRKTPPECCRSEVECMLFGFPRQPNRTSYDSCHLNFRLCVSVPESRTSECLILSQQFSLEVNMNKPLSWDDRTFSAIELPSKSFNFTSTAFDSPNISITLEVWNAANDKLLLYSRNFAHISLSNNALKTLSTTSSQNSLIYQLSAQCHAGYVGEGCALVCQQPSPTDHYHCHPQKSMVCNEGWSGPRCAQPICSRTCLNAGICAAPEKCRCAKGWKGEQCEECIPKQGCSNGYCLSEPGKCICKPNWTGVDCQLKIDKCLEKPCKNGGKCTTNGLHGEAFHCSCPQGFTGEDCTKLLSPCSNTPCGLNGDCIPTGVLPTDIYCRCHPGYWGSDCSNDRRVLKPFFPPTPTINSPFNKSVEKIAKKSSDSFPSEESKQIWVVNALVAVCALLLLMILIVLCAPLLKISLRDSGFNCLHLKLEDEANKKRIPRMYCLSGDLKRYEKESGYTKDEEEVANIRSSLIKNKPIIIEEVRKESLQGGDSGKNGMVIMGSYSSSALFSANRRRSVLSLTNISKQDKEEALELESRQNLKSETNINDTCSTTMVLAPDSLGGLNVHWSQPLSTVLLLKSPPPPYSECNHQENSDATEEATTSTDIQPSTSLTLCTPSSLNIADGLDKELELHKRISVNILPQNRQPTVVQPQRVIDLKQRPGATNITDTHIKFISVPPAANVRHSAAYGSLV